MTQLRENIHKRMAGELRLSLLHLRAVRCETERILAFTRKRYHAQTYPIRPLGGLD